MESTDDVAFIGRNPKDDPNVYIATGDSGAGITHGTIAGILLRDLIVGRDNPWATIYMFRSLLASGLHRGLEFDRAHMGLPLPRLALYSRRETSE
jgi:glycine/D-amino acid oxidase-like deaminating enzyme